MLRNSTKLIGRLATSIILPGYFFLPHYGLTIFNRSGFITQKFVLNKAAGTIWN